jgi:cyclophilin family peptidyl-prolyl cis-trans isomerase
MRALALLAALLAAAPARADCSAPNPDGRNRVALTTVLGVICLDLLDQPSEAPETVQNFLNYYERGDFENSFFHRLIPGFVLQGGGFRYTAADGYEAIPQDPPVANDPDPVNRSNVRGTVAMAKLAMQPDSATNQFFINLGNNAANLDNQNGGFTVFARVVAEDLAVVDQIAALHREYGPYAIDDPLRGQFANLPVLEVLERDPSGYGCLIVYPDPIQNAQGQTVPLGVNNCMGDQAAFNAAVQLTIAAMDPQVPERLVLVPEPASPLLLAAGSALLGLAGRARPRCAASAARGGAGARRRPRRPAGISEGG